MFVSLWLASQITWPTVLSFWLDQIKHGEQEDPHEVDKVPIEAAVFDQSGVPN